MTSEQKLKLADEFEKKSTYIVLHYADGSKGLSTQQQLMVAAALRTSAEPSASVRDVGAERLTPKERHVLKQCIRIALEDGSISGFDPSGKIVASIEKKIGKEAATPSPLMQAAGKADETVPELTSDFAKALPGGTLDDSTYSAIEDALDAIDAPMTEGTRYMTLVERIMALRAAAGKAAPQASAESAPSEFDLTVMRERDEARQLVAEANNSLYGSHGYFHSLTGGPFDKYHLSRGIERLKAMLNDVPQPSPAKPQGE